MNNPQYTANKIKSLAKSKGISVNKLLIDCELNKNSIYTMQSNGYFPRVETLIKIANYLDCSVDYLLGRTDVHYVAHEAKDEMEIEMLKAFKSLDFSDRIEIMNTIIEKTKK